MPLNYPNIDPVLVSIMGFEIRWYPLAYIAGILLGIWYMKFLANKAKIKFEKKFIEDFIFATILGIIIGGRFGYVFIYNPGYYFDNPIEIFTGWGKGMAFHGGLIGFIISTIIVCRIHKIDFWRVLDLTACVAPIGIFLGRIANFINGELFGRITDMPWGMVFPNGGPYSRHPSQLYEALGEGLLLFFLMNFLFFVLKLYRYPKLLSGIFAISYSIIRLTLEIFRNPDPQIGYIMNIFTMGQILSCVFIIAGLAVIIRVKWCNKE